MCAFTLIPGRTHPRVPGKRLAGEYARPVRKSLCVVELIVGPFGLG